MFASSIDDDDELELFDVSTFFLPRSTLFLGTSTSCWTLGAVYNLSNGDGDGNDDGNGNGDGNDDGNGNGNGNGNDDGNGNGNDDGNGNGNGDGIRIILINER